MNPKEAVLSLPAPAKLNLLLHIVGRRADGYHLLQTVFQFLDYGDALSFECLPTSEIVLNCTGLLLGVPPTDNLVYKAACRLQQIYAVTMGVRIDLHKRIPPGSGLGGGSSDAATTLLALNVLWGLDLAPGQLMALGLSLGADVPVFVSGQAAWAEGVGEQLTPLVLPEPWYVVITPNCSISTAAVFNAEGLTRTGDLLTIKDFISGVRHNVCQVLVCQQYPIVQQALDWLRAQSPTKTAWMSGTGASVFAEFTSQAQATAVMQQVPKAWWCFIARGVNQSPALAALASYKKKLSGE